MEDVYVWAGECGGESLERMVGGRGRGYFRYMVFTATCNLRDSDGYSL